MYKRQVRTILHPSFSAAGVVSRTRENGIINGSTDYAGDGLCVLTNLERATETKMGLSLIHILPAEELGDTQRGEGGFGSTGK